MKQPPSRGEDDREIGVPEMGVPETGVPQVDVPLPSADAGPRTQPSEPGARDTRRSFLVKLAKVTAFAPPAMLTLKGKPLNAQANAYQAWANYFQALANFYAAQGAFAAANYYQFWANYLQALANQVAAQQGMLSPSMAPILDPNLQRSPDESRAEPWHQLGPAAPPPWAVGPPGQDPPLNDP